MENRGPKPSFTSAKQEQFAVYYKRQLTKGLPGLIWELQTSASAVWFQGHIFPEWIYWTKKQDQFQSGKMNGGFKRIYEVIKSKTIFLHGYFYLGSYDNF